MADEYTHGHHESVLRSHEARTLQNSAAYLAPFLEQGMSVLDVGAGPGTITVDIADAVTPGHVVGVDAAADVVAKADALGQARGTMNVEFRVDDAYALSAADGEYDVVHAHQLLQHVVDPVAALREFRRVVADDGIVAVRDVDYEGVIWYPLIPALQEWIELYLAVHRSYGGEPAAGRRLKAWAREAGFEQVQASASLWLFESAQDRAWWGGMWADRVLKSSFAERALSTDLADQALLERISAGWKEWAAHPDGWILLPHGEVLARS